MTKINILLLVLAVSCTKREIYNVSVSVSTPLHSAAGEGLEVNVKADDDTTSLHRAAASGDLDLIKLLLENGAAVNVTANDGRTPLHLAVQGGKLDLIKLLLENGADRDAQDEEGSYTPVHSSST